MTDKSAAEGAISSPKPWRGEAVERGEIGPQNDLSRAVEALWLAVSRDEQLRLSGEGFSLDPILIALRPIGAISSPASHKDENDDHTRPRKPLPTRVPQP